MNSDRVRLRDIALADADPLDSWASPAVSGESNDFGMRRGRDPVDTAMGALAASSS
jgi:hypothetical protein